MNNDIVNIRTFNGVLCGLFECQGAAIDAHPIWMGKQMLGQANGPRAINDRTHYGDRIPSHQHIAEIKN